MKNILIYLYFTFFLILLVIYTIFWGIVSLSASLFAGEGNSISHFAMKFWSKFILFTNGIRIKIDGMENINKKNVQIFASNHSSYVDIWVISSIMPVKFGWVSKKEIFLIPIVGWHMKACGYISIDRSNTEKAIESMNTAVEKIKNGTRIVIFPEGTRSRERGDFFHLRRDYFIYALKQASLLFRFIYMEHMMPCDLIRL